ncbi:hypothetical protein A3Q56_06456 [Intoshia linei]|uniref:Uncharacterized protein n=1 Tax=Intoshia linei TaxID=1819745 RepID=A0A177AV01_9BILA|nr:hypothetical protein A3Q56_06456 [Intoshia linei]
MEITLGRVGRLEGKIPLEKEEFKETCLSVLNTRMISHNFPVVNAIRGEVVFISKYARLAHPLNVCRKVGLSRTPFYSYKLLCDPVVLQVSCLHWVTSSIAPKTSSNFPSMIYHQTASLALARYVLHRVIFEPSMTRHCDILVEKPGINIQFYVT